LAAQLDPRAVERALPLVARAVEAAMKQGVAEPAT